MKLYNDGLTMSTDELLREYRKVAKMLGTALHCEGYTQEDVDHWAELTDLYEQEIKLRIWLAHG